MRLCELVIKNSLIAVFYTTALLLNALIAGIGITWLWGFNV